MEADETISKNVEQLEKIYTKIEILLDIINCQIEQKIEKLKKTQIFTITKMKKYKNGKDRPLSFHKRFFTNDSFALLENSLKDLHTIKEIGEAYSSI